MNHINFLPESIRKRRARQQRFVWESLLVLSVFAALVLATSLALARSASLRIDAEQAEAAANTAVNQVAEQDRLNRRRQHLARELWLHQRLASPISTADVLAAVADLAPGTITVRSMQLRAERAAGAKGPGVKSDAPQPVPVTPLVALHLEIDAVAPDDEQIADFVANLSGHPAFDGVKIRHSRAGEFEGHIVRRFRVDLRVPLDRRYTRATDAVTEEVAHAD